MFFSLTVALAAYIPLSSCLDLDLDLGNPSKSPLDPPFDMDIISAGLDRHLPYQDFVVDHWDSGLIPRDCAFHTAPLGYAAADFEAFNVTYPDCDKPWVMCRHRKSLVTFHEMAGNLSHIPIGIRSYLKHLVSVPTFQPRPWCAMTSASNTVVADHCWRSSVLMHELSHSLDFSAAALSGKQQNLVGPDGSFSFGEKWQDAYSRDEKTITPYGMTSWREDFAESGVVALYDLVVPGGVEGLRGNWGEALLKKRNWYDRFDHL
ncbi:hypothetical protein GGS20DRAFT_590295 [Poronia punctata]|nr:hypothetical protein GGS20DRAFT_590295 [Poronia punctata]